VPTDESDGPDRAEETEAGEGDEAAAERNIGIRFGATPGSEDDRDASRRGGG